MSNAAAGAADAAAKSGVRDAACAAEPGRGVGKVLVRAKADRERAAGCPCLCGPARNRAEQLEVRLLVGLGDEGGALDAEGLDREWRRHNGLVGYDVAAVAAAAGFGPHRVAMEERRAVAPAEGHPRHREAGYAGGPEVSL